MAKSMLPFIFLVDGIIFSLLFILSPLFLVDKTVPTFSFSILFGVILCITSIKQFYHYLHKIDFIHYFSKDSSMALTSWYYPPYEKKHVACYLTEKMEEEMHTFSLFSFLGILILWGFYKETAFITYPTFMIVSISILLNLIMLLLLVYYDYEKRRSLPYLFVITTDFLYFLDYLYPIKNYSSYLEVCFDMEDSKFNLLFNTIPNPYTFIPFHLRIPVPEEYYFVAKEIPSYFK